MAAGNSGSHYSQSQRDEALRVAAEVGVRAAAKKLSIGKSSIYDWASKVRGEEHAEPVSDVDGVAAVESMNVTDSREAEGKTQAVARAKPIARRYTPSEKAQVLEYAATHGVSETAAEFGCSRFSVYDWRRKMNLAEQGLGAPPTSGQSADEKRTDRDRAILDEWKQHPGLGPSQIKNQLRRRGLKMSVTTVRRVMEDAGYITPKVKRHEHTRRYESVRPNHLWHLDFLHRNINRSSTFTLFLLDDHSRFVVGHGVDDAERADMVVQTFEDAVSRHGKPEMVMHDRGSAFWSWRGISRFTRLLEELGIDQIVAREKEHNGKVEVFNANIAKELFDKHRFYDLAQMRRRLDAHLDWYNHQRTSHALGGLLVPADRFYGRVKEVMARIESGCAQDSDVHTISLRDRELEFFRVVQRDGVPEIWLLGRKLTTLV